MTADPDTTMDQVGEKIGVVRSSLYRIAGRTFGINSKMREAGSTGFSQNQTVGHSVLAYIGGRFE